MGTRIDRIPTTPFWVNCTPVLVLTNFSSTLSTKISLVIPHKCVCSPVIPLSSVFQAPQMSLVSWGLRTNHLDQTFGSWNEASGRFVRATRPGHEYCPLMSTTPDTFFCHLCQLVLLTNMSAACSNPTLQPLHLIYRQRCGVASYQWRRLLASCPSQVLYDSEAHQTHLDNLDSRHLHITVRVLSIPKFPFVRHVLPS